MAELGDSQNARRAAPSGPPSVTLSSADLKRSLQRPRTLFSCILTGLTAALTLGALAPLFAVVLMLLYRGGKNFTLSMLWLRPPLPFVEGGGFGNALVGTLLIVAIAAVLSVPFGVLGAIFLAETAPDSRLAGGVRLCAKTMTGFPSILAGMFVYGAIVYYFNFSAYAAGVALAILMLPTILLTAEEAIRAVPLRLKEAAIGMGATPTQTVWRVLLPTAMPGILTGVMLAVARAAGETAPLLFTALGSEYWFTRTWDVRHWPADLNEPTASLAVLIYKFSGSAFANQKEMAWSAALVLVLLVLTANLIGQSLSRRHEH